MLTDFGKELRKLRIDNSEKLLDMAARLGLSAGFISSVEVGKKSPPANLEQTVISVYNLSPAAAENLGRAADRSRNSFTLEPRNAFARDTAGLLARRINNLSEEQLRKIQFIVGGQKD